VTKLANSAIRRSSVSSVAVSRLIVGYLERAFTR
jgi:hypothetical protein